MSLFYSFKHMGCIVHKMLQVNTCASRHSLIYICDSLHFSYGLEMQGRCKSLLQHILKYMHRNNLHATLDVSRKVSLDVSPVTLWHQYTLYACTAECGRPVNLDCRQDSTLHATQITELLDDR